MNIEGEQLIFLKLTYIKDEYSKIEFNSAFLIQEAIKFKNLYERFSKPTIYDYIITNLDECMVDYQKKKIKITNDIKEFIEIKLYTF